jgi:uncharacterized membrane protein
MSGRISWMLAGAGLGATATYLLDLDRGARRRARLIDRSRGTVHGVEEVAAKAARDARNRLHGVAARSNGSPRGRHGRNVLSRSTPERRLLDGGAGAALALWGLVRRGLVGTGAAVVGASMIARAATPRMDGIIRVQKTLTIAAPVKDVYGLWSHFENFGRFMEHVIEVRPEGEKLSHWRVTGPAGVPIEWDAETTRKILDRLIAWRSLDGSVVEHHGEVHFEPSDDGSTRISVHMAYRPPAGALGHAVAAFLHGDPRTLMNEDLLRMKSLLENGKATAHHEKVTKEEVTPRS